MSKSFLPPGYKAPAGSNDFMKLEEGQNRFRVLSEAIIGWEGWKDNKPFRRKGIEQNITTDEVDIDQKYKKPKINHIWVFKVYDYKDKKVKILQLTQKTIMKAISGLVEDEDWGDPTNYDISIERTEGNRVSYSVKAYPPKKPDAAIVKADKESELDPEDVFREEGDDDKDF